MAWLYFLMEAVIYKGKLGDDESASSEGTNVGRLKCFSADKPLELSCVTQREQLGQQCSACSSSAVGSFGAVQVSASCNCVRAELMSLLQSKPDPCLWEE